MLQQYCILIYSIIKGNTEKSKVYLLKSRDYMHGNIEREIDKTLGVFYYKMVL